MPYSCCVPGCNGNYNNAEKVSIFRIPKDEETAKRWINAIKRLNFIPTKYTRVCERHFIAQDFETCSTAYDEKSGKIIEVPLKVKRLKPGAIPSKLPNLPTYFSSEPSTSRESPDSKRQRLEMQNLRMAIEESKNEKEKYDQSRTYSSLSELKGMLHFVDSQYWTIVDKTSTIAIVNVLLTNIPEINCSITIDENLEVNAFANNMKLSALKNFIFPCKVNNINSLSIILDALKCFDNHTEIDSFEFNKSKITSIIHVLKSLDNCESDTINFLSEQLSLLITNKHSFRYSTDLMMFATLLYTIGPQAYKFLRNSNNLILPHPTTIQRVCSSYDIGPQSEQCDGNFLLYIKQKFNTLEENDKNVILLLDEIHVKEFFDYKGGSISGLSYDAENCASSAHVFMIRSIVSKFKDVVHVLPVKKLTGEILHTYIKKIIIGLEDIGFHVFCVVTDNNSINRNAMSLFLSPQSKLQYVYPHPCDENRPLFYLVDSVHLLKCIRNNWINQKNYGKSFFFPEFESDVTSVVGSNFKTASFNSLKDLYNLESSCLIKYGYKLSLKALSPSSFEKQNMKLVLQIFNEFVAQALLELGPKHNLFHFKDTSDFILIIVRWWQIINVKSPNKGFRLNNVYQRPLTFKETDERFIFLNKFIDWLELWDTMKCNTGTFSKETQSALRLTTECILQISDYCTNVLKLNYILPGKLQTDDLESRFGFYRRLAGCQYNISLQQLFECEKKLRIQSILHLKIENVEIKDLTVDENANFDKCDYSLFSELKVLPSDISNAKQHLPVIVYLAGYTAFSVLKKTKCHYCKEIHLLDKEMQLHNSNYDFVKTLDRGGLSYPKEHVVFVVLFCYIVVEKMLTDHKPQFLSHPNQRHLATTVVNALLEAEEFYDIEQDCKIGHSFEIFIKRVIWSSVNILLNNYCKTRNDNIRKELITKKTNLADKKSEKRKQASLKDS